MKTKKIIEILNSIQLTDTERQLMDLNITFIQHRYLFLKKLGIAGMRSLIMTVNFRLAVINGFGFGSNISYHRNCITIKRN